MGTAKSNRSRGTSLFGKLMRLVFLLFLLVMAGGSYLVLFRVTPPVEKFIEIPSGSTTLAIGTQLESNGLIQSRFAFDALHLVLRRKLKAGEYRFQDPATVYQVYSRIARGDVYLHTLAIPEGFNIFDIAAAVETAKLGTKEQFLQVARQDTKLIQDIDPTATTLEGYLFPDTYKFSRLDSVHAIAAAMVKRFRQQAVALGLKGNVHETITMASLIEKEVGAAEERPLVASVFVNRLGKKMPLATDPTVIYAALLENRYRGTIYLSDLQAASPYNTYKVLGLPPGPICNPGVASIQSALHPAQSNYLYFVSDNQGHSRFAATLAEHDRNVAAYRKAVGRK
jgi:UPF0755 protein